MIAIIAATTVLSFFFGPSHQTPQTHKKKKSEQKTDKTENNEKKVQKKQNKNKDHLWGTNSEASGYDTVFFFFIVVL